MQQHCVPTRCPRAKPARLLGWNKLRVHESALHKFSGWSWALPRFSFVGPLQLHHGHPERRRGAGLSRLPHSPLCVS